ncbi:hypothetical protein PAMA_005572 [Pampus argenteus]
MSKSSPHLGRPGSVGSKSSSLRKELQGNRSCMLRIGERLMRAGSEGNLMQRPIPAQNQVSSAGLGHGPNGKTHPAALEDKYTERTGNNSSKCKLEDSGHSPSRSSASSAVDSSTERLLQKKQHNNNNLLCNPDFSSHGSALRSSSTLPRSYAAASSRDSELESLIMQQSEVERKKEVFLDHLRLKYPHHAAIIMGHQELMREQVRSPRPSESPPCAGVPGLSEQQDPLAAETMSDGDVLPPTVPFTRGCKARASLPVGHSSGQTRERLLGPGVLYLQYGEETKQVRMPIEISNHDALRALYVSAFPQQLTMKMLQSPNMAIYIKDTSRNVYYDLEDIRVSQSEEHEVQGLRQARCLGQLVEGRYVPRVILEQLELIAPVQSEAAVLKRSSGWFPHSVLNSPGGDTVTVRRNITSHSYLKVYHKDPAHVFNRHARPTYTEGRISKELLYGSHSPVHTLSSPNRSTLHSLQGSMSPPTVRSMPSSPSRMAYGGGSIRGGAGVVDSGSVTLPQEQQSGARRSSTLCTSSSAILERRDVKPDEDGGSSKNMTMVVHGKGGLYYSDGYCTSLQDGGHLSITSSQCSTADMVDAGVTGIPGGLQQYQAPIKPLMYHENMEHQTRSLHSERMKAMEEQIASLAGLVHHALRMGPDAPGVKDPVSENGGRKLAKSRPDVLSESQDLTALIDSSSPASLALEAQPSDGGIQQSLVSAKRNVSELRLQLHQLRSLQQSNQEALSSMLRMAAQELVVLMCDRLAQCEEAVYRQRAEMEEERMHYLAAEERILTQLSELEDYVDRLQRSSTSSPNQLSITLTDVEEGAVNLRRVGEALAILKGEFPELQVKMRAVLKLEVEAMRFLKEEPHKMDSMLKRVKALTEALSSLRRCVSDSLTPARSAQVEPPKVLETYQDPMKTQSPQSSPKPQPRSLLIPPQHTPSSAGTQFEPGVVGSASPIMARRMKTTAASMIQPPHNQPSSPLTPTHRRDSPTVAKVSPGSREGSPALQRRPRPLQSDEPCSSSETSLSVTASTQETHTHTEATKTETPEGNLSLETSNMNQLNTSQAHQPTSSDTSQPPPPDTTTTISTEFDQVLQEVQASLMTSIPDLDVSDTKEARSDSASGQINTSAAKSEQETALDLTLQVKAPLEQQAALSGTQEYTVSKPRDEVDATLLKHPDTAASELPVAAVKPLPSADPSTAPSASPNTGQSSRPQVEKPRRSSVDREMKQNPDRAGKPSPPPPPRRFHADAGEKEPVVPEPNPPRQPPEVKPKPQMCPPCTSTPATASAQMEEAEDDEDNKFMKELQVFQKCTVKEVGCRGVLHVSGSELRSTEIDSKIQIWTDNPLFNSDIFSSRTPPQSLEVSL